MVGGVVRVRGRGAVGGLAEAVAGAVVGVLERVAVATLGLGQAVELVVRCRWSPRRWCRSLSGAGPYRRRARIGVAEAAEHCAAGGATDDAGQATRVVVRLGHAHAVGVHRVGAAQGRVITEAGRGAQASLRLLTLLTGLYA